LFLFLKSIFSQNIKKFTTNINFEYFLKIYLLNLYNKEQICVSVCLFFYAFELWTLQSQIDYIFWMSMARRGSTSHSLSRKLTSCQVTEEEVTLLKLFYGKILHYRVYSLIEIDGFRITLDLTKFMCYDWPLTHKQQNRPPGNECVGHGNGWVAHKK
jgi:hypothetical protein